jgi:hypothetical protein
VGDPEEQEVEQVDGEPKLYATWMAALQAELMLGHLSAAGPAFPEANLYCHACITAMRSVTAMIQKALRQGSRSGMRTSRTAYARTPSSCSSRTPATSCSRRARSSS